jgi:ZIP family zinc transporter
MFQSVVDYFSIDPILAALYASLFTWFLTALGSFFRFMFKSEIELFLTECSGLPEV